MKGTRHEPASRDVRAINDTGRSLKLADAICAEKRDINRRPLTVYSLRRYSAASIAACVALERAPTASFHRIGYAPSKLALLANKRFLYAQAAGSAS